MQFPLREIIRSICFLLSIEGSECGGGGRFVKDVEKVVRYASDAMLLGDCADTEGKSEVNIMKNLGIHF